MGGSEQTYDCSQFHEQSSPLCVAENIAKRERRAGVTSTEMDGARTRRTTTGRLKTASFVV